MQLFPPIAVRLMVARRALGAAALVSLAWLAGPALAAPVCFPASGKVGDDAQAIRLQADGMGWAVGVPASVTAGTVIKSKVALYPKGNVTVCLAEGNDGLGVRAQASTGDDKDAGWMKLPAKRKGAA